MSTDALKSLLCQSKVVGILEFSPKVGTRFLLLSLVFLLAAVAFGQSSLPPCKGTDETRWSNCYGSWADAEGGNYLGEWKGGKFDGQGTAIYAIGDKYVGQWKDGNESGQGTYYFLAENRFKGDIYVGQFKDGEKNGQGTYTHLSGEKYVGAFKDGSRTGRGTQTLSNGDQYVGDFKSNKFNGQGTYTFVNGNKYVGEFKDDRRSGQGTFFKADGRIGLGEWVENKPGGRFIEYRADKTIERSGIFKDGALVSAQNIDPNSFTGITKSSSAPAPIDVARAEVERKAAQLEQERIRLAKEREQLNAEKLQREREEQLKLAQNAPSPVAVQSTKRIALVIGNASYSTRPLKNPRNDADDISRALKTANFDVIDLRDATLSQMRSAVRQFGDKLLNNDVGLVYYSGHGVEVKGKNYFLAVNADIQREDEIADQGLDVALILEKMTTAGKGVNILIVDACRDDPFGRSFRSSSKGLATMDAPRGTIIAYSTSPGKVASDGDPKARNSPYTKALLQAMQAPNRPIEQVFKDVRRSVQAETKDHQTPWENTSLSGDFYFRVQR